MVIAISACQNNTSPENAMEEAMETVEKTAADIPRNPLKNAYFGETHLHSAYSLDAYIGGARKTPIALRGARRSLARVGQ